LEIRDIVVPVDCFFTPKNGGIPDDASVSALICFAQESRPTSVFLDDSIEGKRDVTLSFTGNEGFGSGVPY
jgi:hypothetical protein